MSDYDKSIKVDMRKSLKEHLAEDAKKQDELVRKAAEEIIELHKETFKKLAEAEKAEAISLTLPTDSATRKDYPIFSGCLKYFPAAMAGVSNISKIGNDKHNPGQELHHARSKSADHGDCILRHLIDTEDLLAANADKEAILREVNQMVWRALAYSQILHEKYGAPMAPAAKP